MRSSVTELATMWIRWHPGSDDETPWTEVEVRTVSVRAAFAFTDAPPPAGTRGLFEVRREDGTVERRGACRVVFVRDGVGAGLELRRAVAPTEIVEARNDEPVPPSSHFRRPPSGGRRRSSPKPPPAAGAPMRQSPPPPPERSPSAFPTVEPPTPEARPPRRPTPSSHPTLPPSFGGPRPGTPSRPREPALPQPPVPRAFEDARTPDVDYTPPASRRESLGPVTDSARVDSIFPREPALPAEGRGLPDLGPTDLDGLEGERTQSDRAGFGGLATDLPDLDLDLGELDLGELDLDPSGPAQPRSESDRERDALEPDVDSGLPTLDEDFALSFEEDPGLPPDGAAAFGLPDFEPPAPSAPPEPEFETYEAQVSEKVPRRLSSQPPPGEVSDDAATVAKVATRTRGRGATEGFAIGIDLGTSNTCASIVIDGEPQVIPTRYGTHTVPSVYARVGHRVLVGEPAVKRMVLDPRETIYGSKRLIGRAYTPELAFEYQPYFAYQLAETRDHRFGAAIDNDVVSFEEVATALLEEVRDVASRHLGGPIDRAVITVPAYFTEVQREAVKRAARAARLMVDQLVPEPTAAALAHGYSKTRRGNYVVFDLGGGTFDVSVMRAENGEFQVMAIGGDPFLGGVDIDDMIANYLLEELHREIRTRVDPTSQQLARLREVAEECKRGLSVQETFAVYLKHFATVEGRPVDLACTVSRSVLERLAGPFVERLMEITRETVVAAGLAPEDVHELLLVGGMSRMPLVYAKVEALFHRRADRKLNPDEAVAIGAALLASRIREVRLLDVLPLSIGIAGEGRRFLRLVPRNTPLPMTKSFVVHTERDLQTRFELPLYQGERRDAAQNEYLGTLVLDGMPAREAGRAIDVELQLDDQAVLSVSARDGLTGSALEVHLSREQSASEAHREHDSYTGELEQPAERLGSPLGRFFEKVRGLFG